MFSRCTKFPFQRFSPCIARSYEIFAGVWVRAHLSPTIDNNIAKSFQVSIRSPCREKPFQGCVLFSCTRVPASATVALHSKVLHSLHGRIGSDKSLPYRCCLFVCLFQSAPCAGRNAKGVVSAVRYTLVSICVPGWGYNHSIYHFVADCNILRLFSAS